MKYFKLCLNREEKMNIKEKIIEILARTIEDNNGGVLENGWIYQKIGDEEFDSLTLVNFLVLLEEEFNIYIDENSMGEIDFMNTYDDMVNGIVRIIEKRDKYV